MRTPLDFTNEIRNELHCIQQDCTAIAAALTAGSVAPTTAPTATGCGLSDRSQWIVYHNALIVQLRAHSIAYPV
jgi:hypothetical protein